MGVLPMEASILSPQTTNSPSMGADKWRGPQHVSLTRYSRPSASCQYGASLASFEWPPKNPWHLEEPQRHLQVRVRADEVCVPHYTMLHGSTQQSVKA